MIRLVEMSGNWYGVRMDVEDLEDDLDNIAILADEGNPVLIVDELETAEAKFGIDPNDVAFA